MDLGCEKYYRGQYGNNEFANETSHINGIENFGGIAKMRLSKLRGLSKYFFICFLKGVSLGLAIEAKTSVNYCLK